MLPNSTTPQYVHTPAAFTVNQAHRSVFHQILTNMIISKENKRVIYENLFKGSS